MAVVNMQSLELDLRRSSRAQMRNYPAESLGKVRRSYAQIGTVPGVTYDATLRPALAMTAGDAGSTIDLLELPYGRLRLLPAMCKFRTSLSSGNIEFGLRQYTTQPKQTIQAEDADVFTAGAGGIALSSAAASAPVAAGTLMDFNIFSNKGPTLFATLPAVTATDWLEVEIFYVTD